MSANCFRHRGDRPRGTSGRSAIALAAFPRLGVILLNSLLLCAGLASCSRQPASYLAKVGDTVITREAFEAELKRRAANGQSVSSPAAREAVLNDLIRVEVFVARAKTAGLDHDPEVTRQLKRLLAAKYEDLEWKKHPATPKPEAGEIELYYKANQNQFTSPEKIHVAILFVRVPGKAGPEQQQQVQQQASELRQKALEQAAAQPDFGLLAQENSEDQATRYRGGDCGWITRQNPKHRWDAEVVAALFALRKPGEISPVIRAAEGFYIGKLIERKEAETAPLEAVRQRIEQTLLASKRKRAREEFEQEQRRGLRVEINEPLLKSIQAPVAFAKTNTGGPPTMATP